MFNTPGWEATDDVYGHAPKFDITCIHCDGVMVLRHSGLLREKGDNPKTGMNQMAYKCRKCRWFIRFYIFWELEYIEKIRNTYRGGEHFWVPMEDFLNDEIIKERLADLGYF